MTLAYRYLEDPRADGTFLVGYVTPGTEALTVLGEGYTSRAAHHEVSRLVREAAAAQARVEAPVHRRIVPGFYTDESP